MRITSTAPTKATAQSVIVLRIPNLSMAFLSKPGIGGISRRTSSSRATSEIVIIKAIPLQGYHWKISESTPPTLVPGTSHGYLEWLERRGKCVRSAITDIRKDGFEHFRAVLEAANGRRAAWMGSERKRRAIRHLSADEPGGMGDACRG
jgi:hypothetical protein